MNENSLSLICKRIYWKYINCPKMFLLLIKMQVSKRSSFIILLFFFNFWQLVQVIFLKEKSEESILSNFNGFCLDIWFIFLTVDEENFENGLFCLFDDPQNSSWKRKKMISEKENSWISTKIIILLLTQLF